jgi:hypothetical protein
MLKKMYLYFDQVQEQRNMIATKGALSLFENVDGSSRPHGWFKANWDAAIGKQSGWVGLGVVIIKGSTR